MSELDMQNYIGESIHELEHKHGVKVLYACESGSRAWGFASPDSDYDLRFVYLAPLSWHLKLQEQADTIEYFADNDLDLAGWELTKTLRLFHNCNLAFNEWLGSPVVYHDDGQLAARLRALIPRYFNSIKAFHHYLNTAQRKLGDKEPGEALGIKTLFYIIRPLACCHWIVQKRSMPPTQFTAVLQGIELDSTVRLAIDALLEEKASAREKQQSVAAPALQIWIAETLAARTQLSMDLPAAESRDWEDLNAITLQYLLESQWTNSPASL